MTERAAAAQLRAAPTSILWPPNQLSRRTRADAISACAFNAGSKASSSSKPSEIRSDVLPALTR